MSDANELRGPDEHQWVTLPNGERVDCWGMTASEKLAVGLKLSKSARVTVTNSAKGTVTDGANR